VKEFLRRSRKWQALLEGDLADELVRRRESLRADLDRRLAYLADCLDKLPSHQRAVVVGYYYERQPVESLATTSGRTMEAIYKSLQRIRQALLECVTASLERAEAQA
jgi:RNA polymerase sigma-70 factor (ECF subfamily)